MLRTNSQQLNLHRHIYLSCKAQRNPALQYNIDCEIYQYLYLQGDYIKELEWANLYIAWMYLQLPLQQWGAGNVYLLLLSSWKVNIAENPIAKMGL